MVENTTPTLLHTDSSGGAVAAARTTSSRVPMRRKRSRADYRQTVIDEMRRQIEARLRGDVHELSIAVTEDGRYLLAGWCSRYHVKQMAQHLAMHLVSEGKLINEIEVRSVR